MDKFYGFDLGDAESAISLLQGKEQKEPEVLEVGGARSFITAYAATTSGELLIGEKACYSADALQRKLRFKSRFLTDPASESEIKSFAAGVLGELYGSGDLIKNEDSCFYVGCPAGWDKNARERYRFIFEKAGYPPTRIVSESRAAMVAACQSKHLQVGCDILSRPVLVVDIGSSTTDFAYICGGKEVEMQTAGEVALGGGIMDELLLERAVNSAAQDKKIKKILEESEPWKNYCEFAARRLKEKYFSDEEYWKNNPCTETVILRSSGRQKLVLKMDPESADAILNHGCRQLGGRSFKESFIDSLKEVRSHIGEDGPELLFLTGGVSKLNAVRSWCLEVFPDAVIISGSEPEFSVTRGLSWSGRIDEEMRQFKAELGELIRSSKVEDLVRLHIPELYRDAVNTLVDPILEKVALPAFDRWRSGEIRCLSDANEEMRRGIEDFLRTDEAHQLLMRPVTRWLRPVADALEEDTMPICLRHGVPFSALSLTSYLSAADINIQIETKNIFAVEEATLLIDSILSILIGLLCGGSGIALISAGFSGIAIGAAVSLLVLIMGKGKMEETIENMNLPRPIRRLVPKSSFKSRMDAVSADIKNDLTRSLMEEKNEEITSRMVDQISAQIEHCLTQMAEVVEIPLG